MSKKKEVYSYLIAIWKWFKNLVFILGIPAAGFLVVNYKEWVPEEYLVPAGFVVSAICYIWKNKQDFKKRN